MGERQVTVETPLGTREVAVDPADERQRWLFLAGATAFADYLDAQDGEYDPDLLADFIAHWLRPGEAGTRRLPSGRVLDDPVLLHIATRLGELPAFTPGDRVVLTQDGPGGAPAGIVGEVVGLAIIGEEGPVPATIEAAYLGAWGYEVRLASGQTVVTWAEELAPAAQ